MSKKKRDLHAEEQAAWDRVIKTVMPLTAEHKPSSRKRTATDAQPSAAPSPAPLSPHHTPLPDISSRALATNNQRHNQIRNDKPVNIAANADLSAIFHAKLGQKSPQNDTYSPDFTLPDKQAQSPSRQWQYHAAPAPQMPGSGLDGHWNRRLTRGQIIPDCTVDLHGFTLDSAWQKMDISMARAISSGHRVMLLITGKPRAPHSQRGAIRAAIADWLAASRHAASIAAVRGAHPRHGGKGALYIIFRRNSR